MHQKPCYNNCASRAVRDVVGFFSFQHCTTFQLLISSERNPFHSLLKTGGYVLQDDIIAGYGTAFVVLGFELCRELHGQGPTSHSSISPPFPSSPWQLPMQRTGKHSHSRPVGSRRGEKPSQEAVPPIPMAAPLASCACASRCPALPSSLPKPRGGKSSWCFQQKQVQKDGEARNSRGKVTFVQAGPCSGLASATRQTQAVRARHHPAGLLVSADARAAARAKPRQN